jgi:hypothetical protein
MALFTGIVTRSGIVKLTVDIVVTALVRHPTQGVLPCPFLYWFNHETPDPFRSG